MIPHSELPAINLKQLGELCANSPDGIIVEVGVYKGGSAYYLDQASRGRPLHLYDTFSGIPYKDDIDNIAVGMFADTSAKAVKLLIPRAHIHEGYFPDTLTDDIQHIAFLHIDCDQYRTCLAALQLLWPRMVTGGIVAFDDYPFAGIQQAIKEVGLQIKFTDCKIAYAVKQ